MVEALAASGAFTPFVLSLTHVAEAAGDLEAQLGHVAMYYQQQVAVELHQLCVKLGIAALIVVAMLVFLLYGTAAGTPPGH